MRILVIFSTIFVIFPGLIGKRSFGQLPEQALFMSAGQSTKKIALKYLALGDSYTIGEAVPASDRYPMQLVHLLRSGGMMIDDPEIIATTGWTTDDLLSGIKNYPFHSPYDLVTLLIGVNNEYQGKSLTDYESGFRMLLKKGIELAGGNSSHVIVLSIPDYAYTPFAKESDKKAISFAIDNFNLVNKKIATEMLCGWLDVTMESRKVKGDGSLLASDGLHYSGKEYAIWAKNLLPLVQAALHLA